MGKKDYLKNKYQNVHIYEHHYHVKSVHLSYIQQLFSNCELWNFIPNGGLLCAEDLVQQTPITSNGRAEDLGQETPGSSNGRRKRGITLMHKIWMLPANMKIESPLNVNGQPIGESRQTFKRWLGTFCLSPAYCPLMPIAWMHVPCNHKEDAWIEIEVVSN